MDYLPPPPPAIERPAQPSLLVSARRSADEAPVFYVDATNGDDRRSGRGPKEAWKSLDKVNATAFPPGSRVLFERGRAGAAACWPPPPAPPTGRSPTAPMAQAALR
ncbi:hypothetical protein [Azospirillum formosense]|uniref:hypothetical protein n=1 Tax=Azospirillum formosense TaxID=861533 RepID=UPI00338F6852